MKSDSSETLPEAFPLDEVLAAIDEWWEMEEQDAALPDDAPTIPDIMKPPVEIDSHRAVRALLTIQEVVKIEIPETVIKKGGYDGIDEMKDHLVPKIQAIFEKERKKQNA